MYISSPIPDLHNKKIGRYPVIRRQALLWILVSTEVRNCLARDCVAVDSGPNLPHRCILLACVISWSRGAAVPGAAMPPEEAHSYCPVPALGFTSWPCSLALLSLWASVSAAWAPDQEPQVIHAQARDNSVSAGPHTDPQEIGTRWTASNIQVLQFPFGILFEVL